MDVAGMKFIRESLIDLVTFSSSNVYIDPSLSSCNISSSFYGSCPSCYSSSASFSGLIPNSVYVEGSYGCH